MKTFRAACVLLFLLVVATIASSLWFSAVADGLAAQAEALSGLPTDERAAGVADFEEAWSQWRFAFSLGIHHTEFDRLEDALVAARAAAQKGDDEYDLAVASLADAVAHIRDLLGINWDNLL